MAFDVFDSSTTFADYLVEDLMNEYSHLIFYSSHANCFNEGDPLKEIFLSEAKDELNHVAQFEEIIHNLGVSYDSSDYVSFFDKIHKLKTVPYELLQHAIKMEKEVADNYLQRIGELRNRKVCAQSLLLENFYNNQFKDSYNAFLKLNNFILK